MNPRKRLANLIFKQPESELKLMDKRIKELEAELAGYKDLMDFNLDIHRFLAERDYLSELEGEAKRELLASASHIYNTKAFETIINALMNIQACHSILQASTSKIIEFDRAGINAMQLLKDEFKRLDGIYRDKIKPEEDFDKHEVI